MTARHRIPPSLAPEPQSSQDAAPLYVPPRRSPARKAPRRWGAGRLALFLVLAVPLLAAAVPVLTVATLRHVPPPTTAFMLQSPTRPVHYHWVPAEEIADSARRAVVAAEDQKFYQHHGFDFEAIDRARVRNVQRQRRRGASTISQQVSKNLFLWPGGGYFRKGVEAALTLLIEALWSKDRILEMYLNIAEFGPGIYGVEAAAQIYFGKPAAALTAAEAARLAAVLPSPRRWSAQNPGPYVQQRSRWILRQMGALPAAAPPQSLLEENDVRDPESSDGFEELDADWPDEDHDAGDFGTAEPKRSDEEPSMHPEHPG